MKTRFWILLFLSIAVVCSGLSIWLLGGKAETTAEVYSDGEGETAVLRLSYASPQNLASGRDRLEAWFR